MLAFWASLGFALLWSLSLGYALATGRLRTIGLILGMAAGSVVALGGITERRRLFAAAALVSVLLFSREATYQGVTLSELVLAAILIAGVMRPLPECGLLLRKDIPSTTYLPLATFALVAAASAIAHGEFGPSHMVYALPLLALLVALQVVRNPSDAQGLLLAPVVAVAGLEVIAVLARHFGTVAVGAAGAETYRFGYVELALGPLRIPEASPIGMGTLLAFCASPLVALSVAESVGVWTRWACRALFPIFAALSILTGSRGAILAFLVSGLVTAVLLLRNRRKSLLLGVVCLGVFAGAFVAYPSSISTNVSAQATRNFARFTGSDRTAASYTANAKMRLDTLHESIAALPEHPFGRGLGYLRSRGVDESIVYSVLANGTGIIGVALIAVILLFASWRFLRCLFRARDKVTHQTATVGLATVLVVLIAGSATDSMLTGRIASTLAWFLGCTCYAGLMRKMSPEV